MDDSKSYPTQISNKIVILTYEEFNEKIAEAYQAGHKKGGEDANIQETAKIESLDAAFEAGWDAKCLDELDFFSEGERLGYAQAIKDINSQNVNKWDYFPQL